MSRNVIVVAMIIAGLFFTVGMWAVVMWVLLRKPQKKEGP
jgi:hypothetical protein